MTTGSGFVHDNGKTWYYQEGKEEMPRKRRTITLSLPPEMDEQVRQFIQEEDRTMSEFLREAIRFYMDEQEWLRRQRRQRANARRREQE